MSAGITSSSSSSSTGVTTTYVITDVEASTLTVVLTDSYGGGRSCTFTSSGGLHPDGQQLLTTLMQLVSTGLTPSYS